jgi:hypothetical protein
MKTACSQEQAEKAFAESGSAILGLTANLRSQSKKLRILFPKVGLN